MNRYSLTLPFLLVFPVQAESPPKASPAKAAKARRAQAKPIRVQLFTARLKARVLPRMAAPPVQSWVRSKPARPPIPPIPIHLSPQRAVGWGAGETMTYSVKLAGIEVGRAAISVGRPQNKKKTGRVLTLRGLGETNTFISTFVQSKEEVVTKVKLAGLLPLRSVNDRKTADRKKDRWLETTYQNPVVKQLTKKKGRELRRNRRIVGPLFDPISALYAIRSMPLVKGTRVRLLILNGNSLYEVKAKVVGRERLYTKLGPKNALRIEGAGRRVFDDGIKPVPRKPIRMLTLWLTADATRVPLRLKGDTKLGTIDAEVTSHQSARSGLRVRIALRPTSKHTRLRPRARRPK
jgi:hypothetical protein